MKNIVLSIALFFVFAAAAVIIASAGSPRPCVKPLTYRIASIDPRYNIDKKQLANIMQNIEKLWSTALNKPLISHSDSGEIAIHLIYSDEQQHSRAERKLSDRIDLKKQQVKLLKQQYERLSGLYKKKENDFKSQLGNYNQMADKLDQAFTKWKAGGISASEEVAIREGKQRINKLKYRIDQQYAEVKSLGGRINQKSKQLNILTGQTNQLINSYNEKYGESRKFHQGRYIQTNNRKMIKIFQFNNQKQLQMVLAHEMGHALGLDHVENAKSVMYYLMDDQNIHSIALTEQDIKALKNRCGF